MKKKNIFKINLLYLFLLASCTTPTTPLISSPNPSTSPDLSNITDPISQPSTIAPSTNPSVVPTTSGNNSTALSIPFDFLKLSYNDYYSAELNWAQITGAKSYKIYQDGKIIADNLTGNVYSVKNLTPNTDYTFDIVAVNDAGESNKSSLRLRTFIPSTSTSNNSNNNYVYSPDNINNPSITSTSLIRGFSDDEITINGFNFNSEISGNIVRFGSTIATIISASNNQIKVKIPSGISGSQPISIVVGPYISNPQPFIINGILSLSNNTRKVDEKLVVYGTGFTGFTSAKIDNVDVTNFTVVSDSQISFTVPNPGSSVGLKTITLSNGTKILTNNNPNNVDDLNIINRTIYVNDNPPNTNYNGNSWSDAYNYLQTALAQSISGDEIWIADGTYKPTTGSGRSESFKLKNGVKIYGGFSGSENLLSSRNFSTNKVILSGDIGTINNNSDNSYHVVTGVTGATLDGVTISYGNADDITANTTSNGGGMYNLSSSPTLSNIIFSNNSSSNRGGGLYNRESSSPAMTNITFTDNTSGRGGGMYNYENSSPTMNTITFTNNSAIGSGSTGRGGGMTNYENSSPTMTDIVFSGNTASLRGAGLHNEKQSSPTMTNIIFSSNTSSERGGGIYNDDSSPTLTNVVFSANTATTSGGGMYNYGSSPNIINTIFANNSSKMGGGIYNISSSAAILNNTTLYGNSALTSGGGIYNYTSSFITLRNSIVYGNTSNADNNIYNKTGSTIKVGYSNIEGGFSTAISSGTLQDLSSNAISNSIGYTNNSNTDINPNFLNISNLIGTDNIWRTNDDGLNLSSTTPNSVVNGGTTTQSPLTDIVGRTRSGNPDMGAYEYITP